MEKYSLKINLIFICFLALTLIHAQEDVSKKATYVGKATSVIKLPSISSRSNLEPAVIVDKEMEDGRSSKNEVIIGKDPQTEDDYFLRNPNPMSQRLKGKAPSLVFDAIASNSIPTDPSLALGPNHVFVVFNTGFRIFDKQGNPLTEQLSTSAIFGSVGCCDLTVSYDNAADRWIVSMLYTTGGLSAKIAISSGENPLESTWTVYTYKQVRDYQKVSVWSDGYYMTDNTSLSNKVHVFERDKMIAGDPKARIIAFPLPGLKKSGFYSPQAFNVSGENLPAPGNAPIVFLQDDAWFGVDEDHIKIWTVNVDWENPENSTISAPQELITKPFISVFDGGDFSNLAQPEGGDPVDAMQSTIMNQAQFRKFQTHNSAVFNFVIDADASLSGKKAAIRWYELRQSADGEPWNIYQEGTYISPDGKHAWMGSMIMDKHGNIGMGYTGMGSTPDKRVSSYYTGRFAWNPINTMTIQEQLIAAGNKNIISKRYGDYSKIDIDPSNDETFWFINEYVNDTRKNVIGVFQIAPDLENDMGVISIDSPKTGALTATEKITATIYNYGKKTQSNFPIKLIIDGAEIVTETYSNSIKPGAIDTYTFKKEVDLSTQGKTYSIKVVTDLAGDGEANNNSRTKEITHSYEKDLGVVKIINPETGNILTKEIVSILIKNFGSVKQSNFNVSYSINGKNLVTETVTDSIKPNGGELLYKFKTKGDFSKFKEYTLKAKTSLEGDQTTSNDSTEVIIENRSCSTKENKTELPFGEEENPTVESIIYIDDNVKINDLNVKVNIAHQYVKDIVMTLIAPDGTEVILAKANGGSGNNFKNTIFDDQAEADISTATPPFIGPHKPIGKLSNFNGLNAKGNWKLRLKDTYTKADPGKLLNWTIEYCHESLSTADLILSESNKLIIANKGNNQYLISLPMNKINFDKMKLDVFNTTGQRLLNRRLLNKDSEFKYDLNMSYAPAGVYWLKCQTEIIKL